MNQRFRCLSKSIFRVNRTIGTYFENKLFIIGFLFNSIIFYTIFYIFYRGKNRIYSNNTESGIGILIFLSRYISAAGSCLAATVRHAQGLL